MDQLRRKAEHSSRPLVDPLQFAPRLPVEQREKHVSSKKGRKRVNIPNPAIRLDRMYIEAPVAVATPPMAAARTLIGWMSALQVEPIIVSEAKRQPIDAVRRDVASCRAKVHLSTRTLNQADALLPLPEGVALHIEDFFSRPAGLAFKKEGFVGRLADLRKIIPFQPTVSLRRAAELTRDVSRDLNVLVRRSIPLESNAQLNVAYDAARRGWMVTANDRNFSLQPIDPTHLKTTSGIDGVGFAFQLQVSVMQVRTYNGRHFLADGYHRAVGLLRMGIHLVPVMWREVAAYEDLGALGHLPVDVLLGSNPPLIPDYLDSTVSRETEVPDLPRQLFVQLIDIS
jgi:hypothetical protein